MIHLDEDDGNSVKIDMNNEKEGESSPNIVESLNAAIDEFDNLGTRSKTFGYVSTPESMISMDRMNEVLVSYPNSICKSIPMKLIRYSSLSNVFLLSIPNPISVKFDTIITLSSRSRLIVNVPTLVLRVLKGVDYVSGPTSSLKDSITSPSENEQAFLDSFSHQRFLGIGEVICTMRIAMYSPFLHLDPS